MITFPKQKTVETNRTFRAWKTYHGMYLHFTGSYDYFKYFGNAPWGTIASMEKYFAKYEHQTGFSWQRGFFTCLLYTSPSPRDRQKSRMPSSA